MTVSPLVVVDSDGHPVVDAFPLATCRSSHRHFMRDAMNRLRERILANSGHRYAVARAKAASRLTTNANKLQALRSNVAVWEMTHGTVRHSAESLDAKDARVPLPHVSRRCKVVNVADTSRQLGLERCTVSHRSPAHIAGSGEENNAECSGTKQLLDPLPSITRRPISRLISDKPLQMQNDQLSAAVRTAETSFMALSCGHPLRSSLRSRSCL
jgi:hypothetical protein